MAILKKDAIQFANGRIVSLPNGVISITRKLELNDYYSRSIFFCDTPVPGEKKSDKVVNIHGFTKDEIIEIADSIIRLCMDLKDNVRNLGVDNPDIFTARRLEK